MALSHAAPPNPTVLTEGADSMVVGPQIAALRAAGYRIVIIDIVEQAAGYLLADNYYKVPKFGDPSLADVLEEIRQRENISLVIPIVDEGLLFWAQQKQNWHGKGCHILVSPDTAIQTCLDKLATFQALRQHNLPTPESDLHPSPTRRLMKPRQGRGSAGVVHYPDNPPNQWPENMIWQSFVDGPEYSLDLLMDAAGKVIRSACRERLRMESGIVIKSRTVNRPDLLNIASRAAEALHIFGPVNIQLIEGKDGPAITDINPRTAGGMTLSMQATDNWYSLYAALCAGKTFAPINAPAGYMLLRSFADHFATPPLGK